MRRSRKSLKVVVETDAVSGDSNLALAQTPEKDIGTRERILDVTWQLIRNSGGESATITNIAQKAEVSRQTVYQYFADRSHLLAALTDYLDDKMGVGGWMKQVEGLSDGVSMLWRVAETRAHRSQGIAALVRVNEAERFSSEAAQAAWTRRHLENSEWVANTIVRKLAMEGRVHPEWDHLEAATVLVTILSFRTLDVMQALGWTRQRYLEIITSVCLSVLAGPPNQPRPKT